MEAKRRARNLVADALQRVAASHTAQTTVTVVELPSDDMKGRIIGREGRNIRTLEHLTGVDFIVDDTPQAVVLSSFDGIRREVARMTLEKLIEDGRIHPARIEEMYYLSKAELEDHLLVRPASRRSSRRTAATSTRSSRRCSAGCASARATGRTCSSTRSRSSTSPGSWPSELGASVKTAKRAALLHDLGKAMTHEVEGSHALISAQLGEALRRERRASFTRSRRTTTRCSRRPSRPCS